MINVENSTLSKKPWMTFLFYKRPFLEKTGLIYDHIIKDWEDKNELFILQDGV